MSALPKGSTLGILGGGQLGRLIAEAARALGYRTIVLDAAERGPAAQVCDEHIRAAVADASAAETLAHRSDLVTFEWELIPAPVLERVESLKPLYPKAAELAVLQDRLDQKRFLQGLDLPQTPFREVSDMTELAAAAPVLGYPCLLKRRRSGYDGKGQLRLGGEHDLPKAAALLEQPCVLEAWVRYEREVSIILARGRDGEISFFPLAENEHRGGILHATRVPARASQETARAAEALGRAIAEALGHVGVMAVELFLLPGGALLVNEIAPRVHNSGHYTLGACATSQFEQHVRAVCGMPLGPTEPSSPAVMVNLLGDLWAGGGPRWESLEAPDAKLWLYGKDKAAPGRKMGHIVVLGEPEAAYPRAEKLIAELFERP